MFLRLAIAIFVGSLSLKLSVHNIKELELTKFLTQRTRRSSGNFAGLNAIEYQDTSCRCTSRQSGIIVLMGTNGA